LRYLVEEDVLTEQLELVILLGRVERGRSATTEKQIRQNREK
jgi:hypothetical protein